MIDLINSGFPFWVQVSFGKKKYKNIHFNIIFRERLQQKNSIH
jgi:hypothetical protein